MNKNTTAYEMMKWVKKLFIYYMFDDLASNFYFTGVELDTSFREEFFFGPNLILLLQKYVFQYFLSQYKEIKSINGQF